MAPRLQHLQLSNSPKDDSAVARGWAVRNPKKVWALLFMSIINNSCAQSTSIPEQSWDSSYETVNANLPKIKEYALRRGFSFSENFMEKDGRKVHLFDLSSDGCLVLAADNMRHENSLTVFVYKCPGVDLNARLAEIRSLIP